MTKDNARKSAIRKHQQDTGRKYLDAERDLNSQDPKTITIGQPGQGFSTLQRLESSGADDGMGPIPIGRDMGTNERITHELWGPDGHMLISGPTGTGKTVLARTLIAGAMRRDAKIAVLSAKGHASTEYAFASDHFIAPADDPEAIFDAINEEELDQKVLLVVDELDHLDLLLHDEAPEAVTLVYKKIERLLMLGRSTNVAVVMTEQTPYGLKHHHHRDLARTRVDFGYQRDGRVGIDGQRVDLVFECPWTDPDDLPSLRKGRGRIGLVGEQPTRFMSDFTDVNGQTTPAGFRFFTDPLDN